MSEQVSFLLVAPPVAPSNRRRKRTRGPLLRTTSSLRSSPSGGAATAFVAREGEGWTVFALEELSSHVKGLRREGAYRFFCVPCRVTEEACGYGGRLLEGWFSSLRERHRHPRRASPSAPPKR